MNATLALTLLRYSGYAKAMSFSVGARKNSQIHADWWETIGGKVIR